MYTSDFDEKDAEFEQVWADFMRTNEQIRNAREELNRRRESYGNMPYFAPQLDYVDSYLTKLQKKNYDRLFDYKIDPLIKPIHFDNSDLFD